MSDLKHLFEANRKWSEKVRREDPQFFENLAHQQEPHYLWIGCSDSRVPANQITGLVPGDVFVHRNVANLVVHTDLNALSVIQYSVEVIGIKHIIVCGHYGCGGVQAVAMNRELGLADNWLRHLRDVEEKHAGAMVGLKTQEARSDRLCELNVIEQVVNVCQATIVQNAWRRKSDLTVHGWIYRLTDGLLHDLEISVSDPSELETHYKGALKRVEQNSTLR